MYVWAIDQKHLESFKLWCWGGWKRSVGPIVWEIKYRISRPIRRTFFSPEKCGLNSNCVLCAEGKYHLRTYKYPYIYYTTSLSWDSENSHERWF